MMMTALRRYWIRLRFQRPLEAPLGTPRGIGVTAFDRADALEIISQVVFRGLDMPEVLEVIEDIDLTDLDQQFVAPNTGNVFKRGIWFPIGYQE